MRGEKTYSVAKVVHGKMYEYPITLSPKEQRELYTTYFKLIKKAAYVGHPEAQYDLAQQYEDTSFLGLPNPIMNPKKCVYWYSKACNQGHAEACNNLASFYELGLGCEKNLDFALELYRKSASLRSIVGKKNYKIMQNDLSKGGKYNP